MLWAMCCVTLRTVKKLSAKLLVACSYNLTCVVQLFNMPKRANLGPSYMPLASTVILHAAIGTWPVRSLSRTSMGVYDSI